MRRSDDTADKLRSRLNAFHNQTQPVIDYYERTGKNVNIDADQDKDVSNTPPTKRPKPFCLFVCLFVVCCACIPCAEVDLVCYVPRV